MPGASDTVLQREVAALVVVPAASDTVLQREVAALLVEPNKIYFPNFLFRNIVYISYIIFLTVWSQEFRFATPCIRVKIILFLQSNQVHALIACWQDQDGTEFHPDPARKVSENLYDI